MYKHRAFDVHEMATALCPRKACETVSVSGGDDIAEGGTVPATTSTSVLSGDSVPGASVPAGDDADYGQFLRDFTVVGGATAVKLYGRDGPCVRNLITGLTLWDATSSHLTLLLAFWITIIFLPIVLLYTRWVYRILWGSITEKTVLDDAHTLY